MITSSEFPGNDPGSAVPQKIVFMGCPEFALPSLQALLSNPRFTVTHVYSMPDRPKGRGKKTGATPVKEFALAQGLPVKTPASFRKDPAAVSELRDLAPDFLVVVAYGLILPLDVLSIPRIAPINLHGSVLPAYRGPSPIHQALINGDEITGNTVMLMNERMDEGDILAIEKISIAPQDTFVTLHGRLSRDGGPFLSRTLDAFARGEIRPAVQDHSLATYTTKITSETARLVWANDSLHLQRLVRAMTPFPGAWFEWQGERWKVGAAEIGEPVRSIPGTIVGIEPRRGLHVACGNNSSLHIELIQRPGKTMMTIADFLKGFKGNLAGEKFS